MSLINNMLKDLEERKTKTPSSTLASLSTLKPAFWSPDMWLEKGRRYGIKILLLMVVFVVVFFATRFLMQHMNLSKILRPATTKQSVFAKMATAEPSVKSNDENKPSTELTVVQATLTDMQVNLQDKQEMVQFTLSQPVHYQMDLSDDHQQITLVLADTSLSQPLPTLPERGVIKTITKVTENHYLTLILHVIPNTTVESLSLSDKAPYVLTLTLANPALSISPQFQKEILAPGPVALANQHYQQALKLARVGRVTEAMNLLATVLDNQPDFIAARKTLAILLLQQKQYDVANTVLTEGLRLKAHYIPFIELQAQVLLSEKNPKEALKLLNTLTPPLERNLNYYGLLALAYQQLGQYDMAAQLYGELLTVQHSNPRFWLGMALSLEANENTNAALDAYRHASTLSGLSPDVQAYVQTKIKELGG